jgi:hypothetical protein
MLTFTAEPRKKKAQVRARWPPPRIALAAA